MSWHSFLRNYRDDHPDLKYKDALKAASAAYKNTCTKKNLKKKINDMTIAEVQDACKKLSGTSLGPQPITYMLLEQKQTEKPELGRQEKPKLPSRKSPSRPLVYLEQNLERELDKLLDKVIMRVAYYYANNQYWDYKPKLASFTNKLVKSLRDKHTGLKTDEFDKIIQKKLGALKSYNVNTAKRSEFKTSEKGFNKIKSFLLSSYGINLL